MYSRRALVLCVALILNACTTATARRRRRAQDATPGQLLRIKQWAEVKGVRVAGGVQEPLRPNRRYLVFLLEMFPGHTARGDEQLVGLLGPVRGVAAYASTPDATAFELLRGGPSLAGRIPHRIAKDEVRVAGR